MSTRQTKLVITVVFLFCFLFLARGGWLPTPIRLDTGDSPGENYSGAVKISASGNNVYAVWSDSRNGYHTMGGDIYFNYSNDRGAIWQSSDIRLDTGDAPGASASNGLQISSSGSNVYVVWADKRHGKYDQDIYFNYSTDGGATWQTPDIRLNTGSAPGGNFGKRPQIVINGSNVYVVWTDGRVSDIYYNYSTDGGATWQTPDIRLDRGDRSADWPQISTSGSNVYVVWQDWRFGETDIYFNYSTDNGKTWQATDIRLNTGDAPGANWSEHPKISSINSNVYVTWQDWRNGGGKDIYFNYSTDGGATWQPTDIRLDTGDAPGSNYSERPEISSSGSNVYVVWEDYRNGGSWSNLDIYFNYSTDGGATWQATDIRLDTGDPPGASVSRNADISCSGSYVYVVWSDKRNAWPEDIYFNCSTDGGRTWKTPAVRIDSGDPPGENDSQRPRIGCSENYVYAVWSDYRNGLTDIYFNAVAIPFPDIKANGSDGPVTITSSDDLVITVELEAGSYAGDGADWGLLANTPHGWYYYNPNKTSAGWLPGKEVSLQKALIDLSITEVLNISGLPVGTYTFYFGFDLLRNGVINLDKGIYDRVKVTIHQ